jgi:hypothetical protein
VQPVHDLEWRHLVLRMHMLTCQWLLAYDSGSPDRHQARAQRLSLYEDLSLANDRLSQTAFEMARRVEGKKVGAVDDLGPDEA